MSNPYAAYHDADPVELSQGAQQSVRVLKILNLAMAQGAVLLVAIMLFIHQGELSMQGELLSWIGITISLMQAGLSLVIPRMITNSHTSSIQADTLKELDADGKFSLLVQGYRTSHIVACAMLEGAAVLNAVFYLITKYVGNIIAAAVMIVLIVLQFPTMDRVSGWVRDKVREIELR